MKHPFKQRKSGLKLIREFSSDVAEKELVWHRDHLDRYVKIQEGVGWKLQLENKLPIELEPGLTYYIPKKTYHRVIKGTGALVVEIKEIGQKMKITKNQLREIIAEEKKKLNEQGFHSMSPAGKALANSIKGKFMRMYPDAKVGIDGRGGFITVNGVKAVDMSQATGRGMSDDEMIEKMHAVYAETQIDADVPTADSRMDTFIEGKMKITKRQLRRIIKEAMAAEESYPGITAYDELRNKGDNALRSYMGFMSRAPVTDLEKLGQLWDGIVAAPGDPKGAQELAKSLGFTSPGAIGAGSFHARKIKPGTDYPTGAELAEMVANYKDQIIKKRKATPPAPRYRGTMGGGSRNRPFDRST